MKNSENKKINLKKLNDEIVLLYNWNYLNNWNLNIRNSTNSDKITEIKIN